MLQICCSKTVMAWMTVVAVVAMIKQILHSANFWSPSRASMANMPQVNQPHFPHNLTHNLTPFPPKFTLKLNLAGRPRPHCGGGFG